MLTQSLLKSIIFQKLKSCKKKTQERINHCKINPQLSCKFDQFWTIFFLYPNGYLFGDNNSKTKNRKILIYDFSFVSPYCASFMWIWLLLRGGGGLHILLCDSAFFLFRLLLITYDLFLLCWFYSIFKTANLLRSTSCMHRSNIRKS